MKKLIKKVVAYIYLKVADNHEKDIKKAKKLASKARIKLYEANNDAVLAEVKFDETVDSIRKDMQKMQDKLLNTVRERDAEKLELEEAKNALPKKES